MLPDSILMMPMIHQDCVREKVLDCDYDSGQREHVVSSTFVMRVPPILNLFMLNIVSRSTVKSMARGPPKKKRQGVKAVADTAKTKEKPSFATLPQLYPSELLSHDANKRFKPSRLNNLIGNVAFSSDNFFTADECDAWIAFGERYCFDPIFHGATRNMAHREVGEIILKDWKMADRLFVRMKPYIEAMDFTGEPVSCNGDKMQLYKYEPGMKFTRHIDVSDDIDEYPHAYTDMTVLIYLSECEGGSTRFYTGGKKRERVVGFAPKKGSVLFHAHGERCLDHDSEEVRGGVKYVLRTDVVCVPERGKNW